jgi:hypothetical protein
MRRFFLLGGLVAVIIGATALPAAAVALDVAPSSVAVGGTVTVSGNVLVNGTPSCQGPVTVISHAFDGLGEFAGVGAVFIPVDSAGHFGQTVALKASVAPGSYQVTARCGGGNLGLVRTITVGGLPRTGSSFGPFSTVDTVLLCLGLLGAGALLTRLARR